MRKITAALVGLLLTVGLLVATPSSAQAGVPGAEVYNYTGSNVILRCKYSSNTDARPYSGRIFARDDGNSSTPYSSRSICGAGDIDQFRSEYDARCIAYAGPGYADGWYKIAANSWYKVSDLAGVRIYNFYNSNCSGRPYFTHR